MNQSKIQASGGSLCRHIQAAAGCIFDNFCLHGEAVLAACFTGRDRPTEDPGRGAARSTWSRQPFFSKGT